MLVSCLIVPFGLLQNSLGKKKKNAKTMTTNVSIVLTYFNDLM